jgi:hypothetical protein
VSTILRCENLNVLALMGRCGKAVYAFTAIEGNPLIVKSSMSLTCNSTGLKETGCCNDKIELYLSKCND